MSASNKNKPTGPLKHEIFEKVRSSADIAHSNIPGLSNLSIRSLEVEQLSEDAHVIRGVGGNTTILNTDAGTVLVDSMAFTMQGSLIREKAEALTGRAVVLLFNTDYHLDHTRGNPGFKAGTQVVSTKPTLSRLQALDPEFWKDDDAKLRANARCQLGLQP